MAYALLLPVFGKVACVAILSRAPLRPLLDSFGSRSGVHHTRPWLRAPWKPGQSGNPLGCPKGSRNKLAEQFFVDVYENWKKTAVPLLSKFAKTILRLI
jgi:hypothetical protein